MPMSREDRDELTRRQAALSGIIRNPLWAEQVAEWKREIARTEKKMLRLAKDPRGASQRDLDYLRGWIDCFQWQIAMPNAAERNLLRYLRSQGIEVEEEEMIDV